MPLYSQTSERILSLAHWDLQLLFHHVIQYYDCTIIDSYRTKEKQHEYFTSNPQRSKTDYPTVHNTKPSIAIDVAPFEKTNVDWGKLQSVHFAGYVMGVADRLFQIGIMKHRLRNGADWNMDYNVDDTMFWDACHFELVLSDEEKKNLKYHET